MAFKTGGSIVVDRPVEQVWAWLNDEQHELIWRRPYLKDLLRTGPYAVGARFEGINKGGGREDRFIDEVTEYRPPARIAWRQITTAGNMPRAGSYTLEPQDGRTKFTLDLDMAFTGIARVLELPMSVVAKTMLGPKLLKQFKDAVEQQAQSPVAERR